MPQYFIDDRLSPGTTARITGDDFHHLSKVRRAKPGDPVMLRDADGVLFEGWIASVGVDELLVDVSSAARTSASWPTG